MFANLNRDPSHNRAQVYLLHSTGPLVSGRKFHALIRAEESEYELSPWGMGEALIAALANSLRRLRHALPATVSFFPSRVRKKCTLLTPELEGLGVYTG